ncbi:MAG TPA: glucose 1-dehydrogenase [Chloroflexota bacterium]|jgi:NAD(P)-dependent dehydrogenase (short-subunit alcohol dehydrogenase family)
MFSFQDKVVVVTGAAVGLGRVTALGFARVGARVVASDIDDKGGAETLQLLREAGGEGLYVHADVRQETDVEAMIARTVEAYGRLDCAVNNAGTEILGNLMDQTDANCDALIDTNVKGVFYCLKHEMRQMVKNGGGAIVNQSSVTSTLTGIPGNGLYAATKGAVIALTKTAALEVAKQNVSVNAIAACAIDAPGDMIWQWITETGTKPEQIAAALPVGRMGKPEELLAAVLFLCSDEARYVTGHTLVVDGGFTAQ